MVKNLPAMRETLPRFLGWEDPHQNGTATHSSILAWRFPCTEEPGRLSPWGCKELDMTERFSLLLFSLAEVMFSFLFVCFFPPLDFSVSLPVLIIAFLSLLRNIPLYSYNMSWILFCFVFTHFAVHLSCFQLGFLKQHFSEYYSTCLLVYISIHHFCLICIRSGIIGS